MKKFKRHRDYGFWDQDIRLSQLSQLGDPLEKLNKGVDFEIFRTIPPLGVTSRYAELEASVFRLQQNAVL